MKRFIKAVLIAGLLIHAPVVAGAQDKLVLNMNEWKPYISFETGQPTGLAIEKLSKVFEELGIDWEVNKLPFSRSMLMAKVGKSDGVLISAKTAEREEFMTFSDPLFCDRRYIYVAKGKTFDWQDETSIRGKIVGYGLGLFKGRHVQKWIDDKLVRSFSVTHQNQLIDMLIAGRIDMFSFSEREAEVLFAARKGAQLAIERLEPPLYEVDLRLGLTIQNTDSALTDGLNQKINELGLGEGC